MEAHRLGSCKRIKILVDTNFLILLATGIIAPSLIDEAVDYSYELLVPESVVEELVKLTREAPSDKTRKSASRTLGFLEAGEISYKRIPSEASNPDDDLILLARNIRASGCRVLIASNDRELRRRARQAGIATLYYRESKGLLETDWILL
ncbi:MAG: PIN domain-containing protein [Desulfurococcales archaeon]|nr:PIN domain-containing protein [Desulfurococcales archaeon]